MEPDFAHTLPPGGKGLSALLDALEEELAGRGVPMATVSSVLLAVDELVSNVRNHGGADASVEVAGKVADDHVTLTITDDGPAFDPLAAEAPDTTLGVDEREVGGLGIHLVRRMMDRIGYRRVGNHNCLQFSKSYAPPSPARRRAGGTS